MKRILIIAIAVPLLLFAEEETIGYLGVGIAKLSEATKIALDIDYGILVDKVYEQSPAEKADIKMGDIIMEIDGKKIYDYKDLKQTVASRPNEKIKMHIYRSRKKMTKNVELGEKETKKIKIDMPDIEVDIPDIGELKKMIVIDKEKLSEELKTLKKEIEQLKLDLKELKEKYTE